MQLGEAIVLAWGHFETALCAVAGVAATRVFKWPTNRGRQLSDPRGAVADRMVFISSFALRPLVAIFHQKRWVSEWVETGYAEVSKVFQVAGDNDKPVRFRDGGDAGIHDMLFPSADKRSPFFRCRCVETENAIGPEADFERGYRIQLCLSLLRILFHLGLGAFAFLEERENANCEFVVVDGSLPRNDVVVRVH